MLVKRLFKLCLVGMLCLAVLPGAARASDSHAVEKHFESFCKEWMQIVKDFAAKKMQYRKADQGFIAEYDGFSDEYSTKVKIADSAKQTYIGILSYNEVKFQHHGMTPDAAKKGPFDIVSQSPVKAIFMYRNGQWQN
jgi:hypothetical protein